MNISTAAITSQRTPQHTTSDHKASPTEKELTVSKVATCGIGNTSSSLFPILREIPTTISQPSAANTVVVHHDDNDVQHQQPLPSLSASQENTNSSQRQPKSNAAELCDDTKELDAIIARCAWLQQQWPTPIESIDLKGAAQNDAQHLVPPPDTSSSRNSVLLASVDATAHILTTQQHLLDDMRQQSTTLRNLVAMSDELVEIMTRVARVVDNLCSAQHPKIVIVPSPNPMVPIQSTIISNPAPAPKIKPPLPATPQPAINVYPCTADTLWPPPPPEPSMKTAQKLKPLVRKKRLKAKPSVVRGRPGPSRTKDNLRPP